MDTRIKVQDWPAPSNARIARKMPVSDRLAGSKILMVARDEVLRVYTDEVLRRAGFPVLSLSPFEARSVLQNGDGIYPLVIFGHTLLPEDLSELGSLVRRLHPGTKVLLLRGPELLPFNSAFCDAQIEGLDGPAALIREIHRLLTLPASDGAAERHA